MDVEAQPQLHKVKYRMVGLELRDNRLITGMLFNGSFE